MPKTHGMYRSPEYKVWSNMKTRCLRQSHESFHHYGGRGISICARWLNSFPNFFSDMGPRPKGMTLERKNNNGNYTPSNCVWAKQVTQIRNQRVRVDNRAGVRGVWWCSFGKKWRARITVVGDTIDLGRFDKLSDAKLARKSAERKYWK